MLEKYFPNPEKEIEKKDDQSNILEISSVRKHRIENSLLLEIYDQIDLEKIHYQSIGDKLNLHLKLLSHFIFENEIDEYIDITRRILNYEQSVQKFHNEFKWNETLAKMDKQRHLIHVEIQNKIQTVLIKESDSLLTNENNTLDYKNPSKIRLLAELFIGTKIANTSIWLTRLLPTEQVIITSPIDPINIHVRDFEYVSDWHDEGNLYKQVYIDFNPLKIKREDIKYEIIGK